MKQLKKTILTLVALLALTTGAWADETLLLTIESKDYTTFLSGSKTFDDKVTVTFSNFVYYDGEEGWYADGDPSLLTVAGINGYTITSCKFYTDGGDAETGYTVEGESPSVCLSASSEVYTDANQSVEIGYQGVKKIEVYGTAPAPASSGPKVAWDEDKNTGTFTMPGGNVTLEPEYFPQATVAEGAVTAADADARATTDDPLVKVDATKLTGAKKLMYFVSNSGTNAPAYDAEGWTDQLPTAEKFTEAGNVYVWYYPVGTDEGQDGATATYSDGDICLQSITARIAAAPTYAVTFAEGTEESDKWKAEPATGVTKGQTVTVTYTGSKKVIGVKAEKKAAVTYPLLSAATTSDYGKVVCAAGHLHDAKTAVPDGCTAVGILGKVTETGHGLILALQNATSQTWNTIDGWASASYAGTTLKVLPDDAARGTNLTSYTTLGETTVSNWALAQKSDYITIFENLGSTTGNNDKTYDGNVNAYITTGVGGTAIINDCWSATEKDDIKAWYFRSGSWSDRNKTYSNKIRPVLGF